MDNYTSAAIEAEKKLAPLLKQAIKEAQQSLDDANKALSTENLRPKLVTMIEGAKLPATESVAGIIASFNGIIKQPGNRDGGLLSRSLCSAKSHFGLSDKQSAQIAGAIVACIKGKAPDSLMEWPDPKEWTEQLSDKELGQWAEWLSPDAYQQHTQANEDKARLLLGAKNELLQLARCESALMDIIPALPESEKITIRNNKPRREGIAGMSWEGGEVKAVTPQQYLSLTKSNGFESLINSGELEVIPQ